MQLFFDFDVVTYLQAGRSIQPTVSEETDTETNDEVSKQYNSV